MTTTIKKLAFYLALMATPLFFFTSCDDDDNNDNDEVSVFLAFENVVDGTDIQAGQTYDIDGRNITFDIVNYYISNVRIMDDNGNMVVSSDDVFLAKEGNANSFEIGTVQDDAHAHMVMFTLGIQDTAVNLGDPSQYTSEQALSTTQNMHWSWNSGYIFLKLEGQVDTTATPDGQLDDSFIYHLGTDNLKREVSVMAHGDIDSDNNTITLNFDLATALQNVTFSNSGEMVSHTMNNMPTAITIMDDADDAFSKAN